MVNLKRLKCQINSKMLEEFQIIGQKLINLRIFSQNRKFRLRNSRPTNGIIELQTARTIVIKKMTLKNKVNRRDHKHCNLIINTGRTNM